MREDYSTKEAFETYIDYLALKRHSTSDDYDYHKYNGRVRASFDNFRTRNDVFFFYKLSKEQHTRDLMLANMLVKPNIWVRELLEDTANERYLAWKKKIDSLTQTFKSDLRYLDENFKSNFIVPSDGQHPRLMSLYLSRQITLETFTILCHVSNVFPYWEQNIVDRVVARDIMKLARKYYPFLDVDKKKFSAIVRDTLDLV